MQPETPPEMNHQDGTFDSALTEKAGIERPEPVSSDAVARFLANKKQALTAQQYFEGIRRGDIVTLSKAITLVESASLADKAKAREIVELCLPYSGNSLRIGITGVPGVGKSTFIESFGCLVTSQGHKLAVLAVDPSSEKTKGSILGDKTRMEKLSVDPMAFIRPSPSAGSLGGVAQKTRESLILCEAAGYSVIFIETVGVGQSETAVHSMVDFFLLLMLAGAGDELQGIKRGIMEMADSIVITKADGSNTDKADIAKVQYINALHLFPPTPSGWMPQVLTCSSISGRGMDAIWEALRAYQQLAKGNKYFYERRNTQARYWMYETIDEALKNSFYGQQGIMDKVAELDSMLLSGKISSFAAADAALEFYKSRPRG
jgi:LAO/AO transport system kinase